jgi:hypothetical protein
MELEHASALQELTIHTDGTALVDLLRLSASIQRLTIHGEKEGVLTLGASHRMAVDPGEV